MRVNCAIVRTITFPNTGAWENWLESDTVEIEVNKGTNLISLENISDKSANIDYLKVECQEEQNL